MDHDADRTGKKFWLLGKILLTFQNKLIKKLPVSAGTHFGKLNVNRPLPDFRLYLLELDVLFGASKCQTLSNAVKYCKSL